MTSWIGVGQRGVFQIYLNFRFLLILLVCTQATVVINWWGFFMGLIDLYEVCALVSTFTKHFAFCWTKFKKVYQVQNIFWGVMLIFPSYNFTYKAQFQLCIFGKSHTGVICNLKVFTEF